MACWLGARVGLQSAVIVLGVIALVAGLLAVRLWPPKEPALAPVAHEHTGLDDSHPHLVDAVRVQGGWRHSHAHLADSLQVRP